MGVFYTSYNKKIIIEMNNKKYTICLNMIVKNESLIIEECLDSVKDLIDYWVISDTGSTDGTQDIIKNYFNKHKIPGELYNDKWEDFGTNRTLAIKHAYKKCDYILVMDADDIIVGNLKFPDEMIADAYYLTIGKNFVYERLLLFKSSLKWRYRGVVHEIPECEEKENINALKIFGDYYIDSRRLGYRSSNPDKYLNDALALEKGLEKDPDLKLRYLFYIGQSYMDYGDYEKSIDWYQKRIEAGGWIEEVTCSYENLGYCYYRMGEKEKALFSWLKGFEYNKKRAECLYNAVKTLRESKVYSLAYYLALQAKQIQYPANNSLFIKNDIYRYKIDYELSILSYYVGTTNGITEIYKNLLNQKDINISHIIKNYNFYKPDINELLQNNNEAFVINGSNLTLCFEDNFTYILNNEIKKPCGELLNNVVCNYYGSFNNSDIIFLIQLKQESSIVSLYYVDSTTLNYKKHSGFFKIHSNLRNFNIRNNMVYFKYDDCIKSCNLENIESIFLS